MATLSAILLTTWRQTRQYVSEESFPGWIIRVRGRKDMRASYFKTFVLAVLSFYMFAWVSCVNRPYCLWISIRVACGIRWWHAPVWWLACVCIIDGAIASCDVGAALLPSPSPPTKSAFLSRRTLRQDESCSLKKMAIAQEVGVVLGPRHRVWFKRTCHRAAIHATSAITRGMIYLIPPFAAHTYKNRARPLAINED